MTHRRIYNEAKRLARLHLKYCSLLGEIEQEMFGFEFADTDSDQIIDSVNYGTQDYSFEEYLEEMKFYKKSAEENDGDVKANGCYQSELMKFAEKYLQSKS